MLLHTCQATTVLLELAGKETFPLGHLLIPGLQYLLSFPVVQGQSFWVSVADVGPSTLHAVGVLQLPAHHAHQQLVERVIVHEVVIPPHGVGLGGFLAAVGLVVGEQHR